MNTDNAKIIQRVCFLKTLNTYLYENVSGETLSVFWDKYGISDGDRKRLVEISSNDQEYEKMMGVFNLCCSFEGYLKSTNVTVIETKEYDLTQEELAFCVLDGADLSDGKEIVEYISRNADFSNYQIERMRKKEKGELHGKRNKGNI